LYMFIDIIKVFIL